MRKLIDVKCKVIRFNPLAEPSEWCWGDFEAFYSDGTKEPCHINVYHEFIGIPAGVIPSVMIDGGDNEQ